MKIEDGIYRVDGVTAANAYLVERPEGLTLVDTGMPGSEKKILAFMRSLGHEPAELTHIVLTHPDPDHVGGVAELKRLTGASVAIGSADASVLAGGPSPKMPTSWLGIAIIAVLGFFIRIEPVTPDVVLADGDEVGGLRVMETPGHTPGSIALWLGDVVFSGDTLLGNRDGSIREARPGLTMDMALAEQSAERIMAESPRLVLPGHGPVVRLR